MDLFLQNLEQSIRHIYTFDELKFAERVLKNKRIQLETEQRKAKK